MDKNILLKLIKKDIEELDLLASALDEAETVNNTLLNLAVLKAKSIQDELLLLLDNEQPLPSPLKITLEEKVEQTKEEKPVEEIIEDVIEGEREEVQNELEATEVAVEETNSAEDHFEAKEPEVDTQLSMEQDETDEMAEIETEEVHEEAITIEAPVEPIVAVGEALEAEKEENINTAKPRTLGESFLKEDSLNDKLAGSKTGESKIKAQNVTNLKAAIGLNDKFQYIRELFNNDADLFNKTIDELNELENIEAAADYLEQKFKWTKNDTSMKFTALLKRKFGA